MKVNSRNNLIFLTVPNFPYVRPLIIRSGHQKPSYAAGNALFVPPVNHKSDTSSTVQMRDPVIFFYSDTSANEDNSFRNHIR